MRTLVAVFALTLSTFAVSQTRSQTYQDELALSGGVFFAVGASNTGGFGLNVGLRDRVLAHLKQNHRGALDALKKNGACFGLMIDRFFPTAFGLLADAQATDQGLTQELHSILNGALKTGCTVVVVDILSPTELAPAEAEIVKAHLPLQLVQQAISQADAGGTRAPLVNKTIAEFSKKHPRIQHVSFNEAMAALTAANGLEGRAFTDLFQNDGNDIHVNYLGQGHLFNVYGRAALERLSGVPIAPIALVDSYSAQWESDVLRAAASMSASVKGIATILNAQELAQDSHQVKGTQSKGVMTQKGDLELIDKVVRKTLGSKSGKIPLLKVRDNGKLVYELDFTGMAYTRIRLYPTAANPKVFVGMGTDYWGYALGFTRINKKALTNYVFELTEIDEQRVDIVWKILPQLQLGKDVQAISSTERAGSLDEKRWVQEIQQNIEQYDRLEYPLETQVEYSRP